MKRGLVILLIFIISGFAGDISAKQIVNEAPDKDDKEKMAWKFGYDDIGLMTSLISPGGAETKISYKIDESEHFLKQVTREHADSSEVVCEYDGLGRRVIMKDPAGKTSYRFDKAGHLTNVKRDGYPEVSYTYDTMGQMSSMSIDDEFKLKYMYDFLGRLSKVKTDAGDISYNYQTGLGEVIRTLPNEIRTIWKYRPDGNLEEISHVRPDNKVITQFKYDYRADGLIRGMSHWNPRWGNKITEFGYDKVQRLINVIDSSGKKIEYQYDKLGNRTALTVNGQNKNISTYNWAGQMLSNNGQACHYNSDGNLTLFSGKNGEYQFEYNPMGLVKEAKLNGLSITYKYDGDGYLIARTTGNKKTMYVPDPLTDNWNPILSIDSNGEKTFYVWDGQSPLMSIKGKMVKFFLNDHLGSVRCIADKKGKIGTQYNFSPFGVSELPFMGDDLIPGYAGLFFDQAISMYLTRARVYDPQTGQFFQTDPQHRIPFGSQKDLSLYAYCGGDPINFVDRNGYVPQRADLILDPRNLDCVRDGYVYSHTLPGTSFSSSNVEIPSLVEEFNSFSKGNLKDLLLEIPFTENAPYPLVSTVDKMFSGLGTITGVTDYVNTAIAHPGDPATVIKQASFYLRAAGLLGLPLVGEITGLAGIGTEIGNAVRSRMIQNRALGLVRLPPGERIAPNIRQVLHKDWGDFTMESDSGKFSASGGWSLAHSMPDNTPLWHFWKRSSQSNLWARYNLTNYNLDNGTNVSGTFHTSQQRIQSGDSSTRKTMRYSKAHYSYDGAAVSKAVEEYNRTGVYDLKKWQKSVPKSQDPVNNKIMLIDIPGVNWKGSARDNDWGVMLGVDKTTIYIRHEGSGKDDWATPKEVDAIIVTLPNKWNEKSANENLLPHIKSALSQSKDVHCVIDMNITLSRHVLPFPKMSENQWAGNVADYISKHRTENYTNILAEHSRGTHTNKYIHDFSQYDTVLIASPRGDDALSWINKHELIPETYIITGLSDAPAWRWTQRLRKIVQRPNLQIVQLQDLSNPASTHSRLQNVETNGRWKQITNTGENIFSGRLRDIISPAFYSKRNVQSADKLLSPWFQGKSTEKFNPPYQRRREYLSDIKYANFWGGDDGGPGGGGSPMSPSNIGGVYLKDAGKALGHLGPLNGIAVDEKSGELILISEQDGKIDLSPLRMDDVVTVFKSVYELGESPFVSIDPDPKDPRGPTMNIRHGKGTNGTYVGWVLFESDRVMKGFSLGEDNITRQKIDSGIKDYESVFDMGFDEKDDKTNKDAIWQRFWIVPAKVNIRQTDKKELTLFDVPLKVNTQRMKMEEGKLVPADDDTPTMSAKTFAEWFTREYDQIGAEVMSNAPPDCGIDASVAGFLELRRVAVITAIAESLRAQGVPMPSWMHDYPVKSCKMAKTTPAIRKEAQKTVKGNQVEIRTRQMYGGVNLAAEKEVVHMDKAGKNEETFARKIQKEAASVPVLSPIRINSGDKTYDAVALPGNDTLDLGANQLAQTDLVVPVMRGMEISLVRKYNSFFVPDEALGRGWTLDFPRLEEHRQPTGRTSDAVTYSIGYQLTSPLNTYSELFKIRKDPSGIESKSLLPEKMDVFRCVAQMNDKEIGFETCVLIFLDGQQWHFDKSGSLVAQVNSPSKVIYRRSKSNNITRIEGWYGKNLYADIKLNYDKQGRMESAIGSNKTKAEYEYGSSGELKKVILISEKGNDTHSPQSDMIDYEYTDSLLASITWNGKPIRQFEYHDRGRLASETSSGLKCSYHVSYHKDGIKIVSKTGGDSETAVYDNQFRPIEKTFWNGRTVKWDYHDSTVTKLTLIQPGGESYFVENATNDTRSTLRTPEGDSFTVDYDDAGRPVRLSRDGRQIIKQTWHPNGLLALSTRESVAVRPQYSEDNILTDVLLSSPGTGSLPNEWAKVKYNIMGQPVMMTDFSGFELSLGYDKNGSISLSQTKQGRIQVKRDKKDRVKDIETTWGYHQSNQFNAKTGQLEDVTLTSNKQKARLAFDDKGRLTEFRQFDTGVAVISYDDCNGYENRLKQIRTPNDTVLDYHYDSHSRLAVINCDKIYQLNYDYDEQGRLISLAQMPVAN